MVSILSTSMLSESQKAKRVQRSWAGIVIAPLIALTSCSALEKYDITLNERSLYSPRSLFEDYHIADPGLASCVAQAIEDGLIYTSSGLEVLNCSDAGIRSLSGLSQFQALQRIKLTDNVVRNLVELTSLERLTELQLDSNLIVDIVPLVNLPALEHVNLMGNDALQCHSLDRFNDQVQVTKPEHC
ncbi:hypothetical protein N9N10_01920 [Luminiphilus sp.]|jgi:Leucine-rich repeat (LRR) protein|nr:hypothetical protein [Luminiphilus sp.]MDB2313097.1 hypothetical protein [Luminiphilus sp.]MDB2432825.1 hypothetical protein [Luminiphilus sp.]